MSFPLDHQLAREIIIKYKQLSDKLKIVKTYPLDRWPLLPPFSFESFLLLNSLCSLLLPICFYFIFFFDFWSLSPLFFSPVPILSPLFFLCHLQSTRVTQYLYSFISFLYLSLISIRLFFFSTYHSLQILLHPHNKVYKLFSFLLLFCILTLPSHKIWPDYKLGLRPKLTDLLHIPTACDNNGSNSG